MPGSPANLASPRLRRLVASRPGPPATETDAEAGAQERCELCGAPLPAEHRHLVELASRSLLCSCRPCALLFDRGGAGGGRYRLVGDRRTALAGPGLDDAAWERLALPVEMAFFFFSSAAGRVVAFYPSPMGATECRLELQAWDELARRAPALAELEPDVEALLVNRARGARRAWRVPIDDCYRLVAVIRTRWRGFTGGREVWLELERFFSDLDRQARR